jgi:Tol biopolymer transport system component
LALTPGARLGVYEIGAQIGEGGMGQVYRATDTKLKRQVAIKVLPPSLAAAHDRLARFQREAEVLASLNHPHIAGIYGLEESGGVSALVMELVEGEDLSQRLARGAIPFDEALPIAKQIVDALEAAHEQGIIHRDLKPANIKVRADGTVKVLDFGLAKAMDPAGASSVNAMNSPTLSMHPTQAGIILGTAAYMSPEQARGKAVDRRADIWAFGVVLFEMLTGTRAFAGDDVSDVLASVLKDEVRWDALPADVPAPILRMLRRCLEKDPKRRLSAIADARLELDEHETPAPQATAPRTAAVAGGRLAAIALAVAAVVVIALAIPAMRYLRETPAAAPPQMRVEINTPAMPLAFVLSPDGRYIAFVASGDGPQRLWLRLLDKTDAQPLPGTDGADYPFWSPDSRSVGFFAAGKIRRVEVAGGQPQDIAQAIEGGATWNAEGTILFTPSSGSPLSRVAASGGQVVAVTRLDPPRQTAHRWPHFLPDGRHFLFTVGGSPDELGTYLGSLDGSDAKRLTTNLWGSEYLPPDLFVTVRQGALVAQRLDLARRELTGDPMTLAYPVDYAPGFFEGFSVSANGLVAYRASGGRQQLTWLDRNGRPRGVVGEPDTTFMNYPELSPDDRTIAVQRVVQANNQVWLMDSLRVAWSRFTFDTAANVYPLWSPDGTRVVFSSNRNGVSQLYQKSFGGTGAEELLRETPNSKIPQDWSRDGRFLLYSENDPKTGSDLWVLEMTGTERRARAFLNTPFDEMMGKCSPDGRWIAYETNESGRSEIVVTSFPDPNGHWQVSTAGGKQPRWRADGRELYFIATDGKLMAVPVSLSGSAFDAGAAVALFQAQIVTSSAAAHKPQYAVAHDGRFLINQPIKEATATPITLLVNWNPEAKQ